MSLMDRMADEQRAQQAQGSFVPDNTAPIDNEEDPSLVGKVGADASALVGSVPTILASLNHPVNVFADFVGIQRKGRGRQDPGERAGGRQLRTERTIPQKFFDVTTFNLAKDIGDFIDSGAEFNFKESGLYQSFADLGNKELAKDHPLFYGLNLATTVADVATLGRSAVVTKPLKASIRKSVIGGIKGSGVTQATVDAALKSKEYKRAFRESMSKGDPELATEVLTSQIEKLGKVDTDVARTIASKGGDMMKAELSRNAKTLSILNALEHPFSSAASKTFGAESAFRKALVGQPEQAAVTKLYGTDTVAKNPDGFLSIERWAEAQLREYGLDNTVDNRLLVMRDWIDADPTYAALTPQGKVAHFQNFVDSQSKIRKLSGLAGSRSGYVATRRLDDEVVESMVETLDASGQTQPQQMLRVLEENFDNDYRINQKTLEDSMAGKSATEAVEVVENTLGKQKLFHGSNQPIDKFKSGRQLSEELSEEFVPSNVGVASDFVYFADDAEVAQRFAQARTLRVVGEGKPTVTEGFVEGKVIDLSKDQVDITASEAKIMTKIADALEGKSTMFVDTSVGRAGGIGGAEGRIIGELRIAAKKAGRGLDSRPINLDFSNLENSRVFSEVLKDFGFSGVKFNDVDTIGRFIKANAILPQNVKTRAQILREGETITTHKAALVSAIEKLASSKSTVAFAKDKYSKEVRDLVKEVEGTGYRIGRPPTGKTVTYADRFEGNSTILADDLAKKPNWVGRTIDTLGLSTRGTPKSLDQLVFQQSFTQNALETLPAKVKIGTATIPATRLHEWLDKNRRNIEKAGVAGDVRAETLRTVFDIKASHLERIGVDKKTAKAIQDISAKSKRSVHKSVLLSGDKVIDYMRTVSPRFDRYINFAANVHFNYSPTFAAQEFIETTSASAFYVNKPTLLVRQLADVVPVIRTLFKSSIRRPTTEAVAMVQDNVMSVMPRTLDDFLTNSKLSGEAATRGKFTGGIRSAAKVEESIASRNFFFNATGQSATRMATTLNESLASRFGMTLEEAFKRNPDGSYTNPKVVNIMREATEQVFHYKQGFLQSPLAKTLNIIWYPFRFQAKTMQLGVRWMNTLPPVMRMQAVSDMTTVADWLQTPEGEDWRTKNHNRIFRIIDYVSAFGGASDAISSLFRGDAIGRDMGKVGGMPLGWLIETLRMMGTLPNESTAVGLESGRPFPRKELKDPLSDQAARAALVNLLLTAFPSMSLHGISGGASSIDPTRDLKKKIWSVVDTRERR